jgi:hypothetical protein
MPGITVGYVEKVTEGADALFDDEEERACQLLALRGCSPEVCKAICAGELASGCPPKGLFDHIKGMNPSLMQMTIADVSAKVAAEEEAAGRLEEASALMLAGDYGGALKIYDDVLAAQPDNEEATRGAVEAKKGQQFMAMVESGSDGDMLAMMMSNLGDDDGDVEIPSMPPPTVWAGAPAPAPAPVVAPGGGLPRSPFSREGDDSLEVQVAAPGTAGSPGQLVPVANSSASAGGGGPSAAPVFGDPTTYGQPPALTAAPALTSATDILTQQRGLMQQQQQQQQQSGSGSTAAAGAI